MNFGNSTEPQGAVSTATLVYERGASGIWYSFQTIFINPYQWFMNTWFRRVRLTTMGDLFEDRFNSRGLSRSYALFQIGVAVLLIGFGCYTAYKITSSLVLKPEAMWTPAERQSVENFYQLKQDDALAAAGTLPDAAKPQYETLQDLQKMGALHSTVSYLAPAWCRWTFYLVFVGVVGTYILLGGMKGAALNNALQGLLIVAFSVLLIPAGIKHIGGWHALAQKVPPEMFQLVGKGGTAQFSIWDVLAITLVSVVQMNALSPNMAIFGSAKNEYAARFGGVAGTYAKRFMIILWAFAGLIAIAMYSGASALADADLVWGTLSKDLLGTGLIGLMLAGVIAAVMSNLAAKSVAISSLFVHNLYRHIWPNTPESRELAAARWAVVGVLLLGVTAASYMRDMESVIKLVITVNAPFGVAVVLIFFWRRLTAGGVWIGILLSVFCTVLWPLLATNFAWVRESPALTIQHPAPNGKPAAVYFDSVVHEDPQDLSSTLVGQGRFNMECYMLDFVGVPVAGMTPNGRLNAELFFDSLFPLVVMLLASYITPRTEAARVDLFYGKMKTPVGATPELDIAAMAETRRNPNRFKHTKLFPGTSWEFGKWDRVDTVGFLTCCAVSTVVTAFLFLLLHWASGT
jgi:Na+/proline symporter